MYCEFGLFVIIYVLLMYLYIIINDCNFNYDLENNAGYFRVFFVVDFCKMFI